MKKNYAFLLVPFVCLVLAIFSCSESDDDKTYTPLPVAPEQSISVDLTRVPYPKLSDYHFFEGIMKNLQPAEGLLPFEPASTLFSDYAKKKRFVWMPKGTKATYNSDGTILEMPIGGVLVKTFYYENVQNVSPVGATRIVETRLMIRKADRWIFANYIWNAEQTEAYYNMAGGITPISWKDENNVVKSANYKIPEISQCQACHRALQNVNGHQVDVYIPIGIKPQNLNFNYHYGTATKNQLEKWIEMGYLESGFSLPSAAHTVINYSDAGQPLELRARSYFDANCAHCHEANRYCSYRPMRMAFSNSSLLSNMGVCVDTQDLQDYPLLNKIVTPGKIDRSMLFFRMNTVLEGYRMPLHGRSIVHEEGVALIREWINSLHDCE
ncbi:hypothetical protein [Flavobacterium sp.]|uniref:hypothetical protein n=1 Tax=Flavobacterium sp. TaxID=239 RepID=UPI0039E436D9